MINKHEIFKITLGNSPLIAAAVHDGHHLRFEVKEIMALNDEERLREEDPYTSEWARIAETQIIGLKSRFEMDLNRPREKAVYIQPQDAWGLNVWKTEPVPELVSRSLAQYDAFYKEAHKIFTEMEKQFGCFVVFDLHTYNHHRMGPDKPFDSPEENPEVNIGTGTLDRKRWGVVIDRLINDLRGYKYMSRQLDVRENIKFRGGNFSRWIHENFPQSGCSIAIEFKKFFMDEWTGKADLVQLNEIKRALQSTVPGVLRAIKELK